MSIRNSKASIAVTSAYQEGYRVVDGKVIHPNGEEIVQHLKSRTSRYYRFRAFVGGERHVVMTHQFVAYQKYGDGIFEVGILVRHLDNNSENNLVDNIAIGTQSQNMMDLPPEKRRQMATGGQKFSPEFVAQLRKEHTEGTSYRQLQAKYGLPKSTLSYYLSSKAKKQSFSFPKP